MMISFPNPPPPPKKQGALYVPLDFVRYTWHSPSIKIKKEMASYIFPFVPSLFYNWKWKQQNTLVFVVSREIFVPARCRTFLHFNESHIRCCQRDGQLMVIISKKVSTRTYSTSSKKEHWCAPRNNNPKSQADKQEKNPNETTKKKKRLLKLTSLHMTQNFS